MDSKLQYHNTHSQYNISAPVKIKQKHVDFGLFIEFYKKILRNG